MTTNTRYAYNTATTIQIVAHWCDHPGGCGIAYGLPQGFIEARLEDHKTWYCPNGCQTHYPNGPSKEARRTKELERELGAARSLAQRESRRRADAEHAARTAGYRARAAKGQLTKARKRMAAGVCPCCNRTFSNVVAHMAGQHPDFLEQVRHGD